MPTTRPSSIRTSSTVKPSRISAPASAAASTSSLSSTVRRGQYATGASFVPGDPRDREGTEVEGVGVDRRAAGRREAIEQAPARERGDAASGCTTCVDTVSLGKVARSTTSTR